MEASANDLQHKVCDNCLVNFQKVEDAELRLAEAQRKVQRLEDQVKIFTNVETRNQGTVDLQLKQL